MNNLSENEAINYSTEVIIEGKQYFRSLAHQLADFVCAQKHEEFRLTADKGFTSASIYMEQLLSHGDLYNPTKYSVKKCLGVLLYDVEKNIMTLRKTNVDRTVHEFHADGELDDCFAVQYEIFKYLRDSDVIQIHTKEREGRKHVCYKYRIKKYKALRNGRFLHFKGHGTQFFIPVADFYKEVDNFKSNKKHKKQRK